MRRSAISTGAAVLLLLSGFVQPKAARVEAAPFPVKVSSMLSVDPLLRPYRLVKTALPRQDLRPVIPPPAVPPVEPPVLPPEVPAADKPSLIPGDLFLAGRIRVMAFDGQQLWAVGDDGKTLITSMDDGVTWTDRITMAKTVQTIHITPRGIMLVAVSSNFWTDQFDGEIYRSADGGASFASVLPIRTGHVYHWNIASDNDGYIFISEYGYKGTPENGRRIYRSADDGETWSVVYAPEPTEGYHNHKILIDSQNPQIIYQSVGDGPNSQILKSVDRGDTWQVVSTGYNPTAAVQFDDHILWGLDSYPFSGFISQSKVDDSIRPVFSPPAPYAGSVYDILAADGVLYAGFLSYEWASQPWNGTIWISRNNGESWNKWVEWPKKSGQGIGFYHFVPRGTNGYLNVTLPVRTTSGFTMYRGTVRFPLLGPALPQPRPGVGAVEPL